MIFHAARLATYHPPSPFKNIANEQPSAPTFTFPLPQQKSPDGILSQVPQLFHLTLLASEESRCCSVPDCRKVSPPPPTHLSYLPDLLCSHGFALIRRSSIEQHEPKQPWVGMSWPMSIVRERHETRYMTQPADLFSPLCFRTASRKKKSYSQPAIKPFRLCIPTRSKICSWWWWCIAQRLSHIIGGASHRIKEETGERGTRHTRSRL